MAYNQAQREAQKRYRNKGSKKIFALTYTPTDMNDAKRLMSYIDTLDISTNAYLKGLVKKDLDEKGIPYPQESNPE